MEERQTGWGSTEKEPGGKEGGESSERRKSSDFLSLTTPYSFAPELLSVAKVIGQGVASTETWDCLISSCSGYLVDTN